MQIRRADIRRDLSIFSHQKSLVRIIRARVRTRCPPRDVMDNLTPIETSEQENMPPLGGTSTPPVAERA